MVSWHIKDTLCPMLFLFFSFFFQPGVWDDVYISLRAPDKLRFLFNVCTRGRLNTGYKIMENFCFYMYAVVFFSILSEYITS